MKANILVLAGILGIFASSAMAYEVGEKAQCVVLTQVQPKGASDTEGCIRDVVNPAHKYTIIEFFSIHCSACSENLPILSKLSAELSSVATIRQVSVDRKEADVRAHIKAHSDLVSFPVALDLNRDATRTYGVRSTPTTYILDRKNIVRFKALDVLTDQDIQRIKDLVRQ